MGLFRRKDSRNSNHDKDDHESFVSSNSARTSNASLKVPLSLKSSGSPPIPEMPISPPPDPNIDPVAYLRSIHAVRQRSKLVMLKAKNNQLNHFDVDLDKFGATAQYVVSIIKVRSLLFYSFAYYRY